MNNPIYETALKKARAIVDAKGLCDQKVPDFKEAKVWAPYALTFRIVTKITKKLLRGIGK